MRVLVENKSNRDGLLEGLTDNWLSVRFAGPTDAVRTIQHVRLGEAREDILYGELASPARIRELRLASRS